MRPSQTGIEPIRARRVSGNAPVNDPIEAEASIVRPVRQMPRPGHGNRVTAGDQSVDVAHQHTAGELDGMLVVVAGTPWSLTRRRVAVVDVLRRNERDSAERVTR